MLQIALLGNSNLGQLPHTIPRLFGFKGLKQRSLGTLRLHLGGTLDVEGSVPVPCESKSMSEKNPCSLHMTGFVSIVDSDATGTWTARS